MLEPFRPVKLLHEQHLLLSLLLALLAALHERTQALDLFLGHRRRLAHGHHQRRQRLVFQTPPARLCEC